MKSTLVGICLLLLTAACQTTAAQQSARSPGRDCVFLQLRTGPNEAQLTKEQRQEAFAGHFANMTRLFEERELLLAGPYGNPKRDPELRGLFVLAPADIAGAEALAASDPCVKAGVFRTESVRLRTRAPLDAYVEHELAIAARDKAAGVQKKPGEGGRAYVWLTAADGRRAREALLEMPGILLWGDFADGRAVALLDALDLDACTALLGTRAERVGAFVLDPWFASGEVAKLPTFSGGSASP